MSWHSREELLHQVVLLHTQGTAQRAIARALGVSRNTVKVLIRVHRMQRESAPSALGERPSRAPRTRKIDAYRLRVAALLEKYPDITAQRVYEILRAEGFDGGQTAVKKYMRQARPAKKPAPSLTTPDYGPGEMAESDWSPYEVHFTTGKKATIQALSYVLVTSKRKFFELYETCDLHALMDGHALAFARFEGCAAECKYDSQKPVVLRWEGSQPIYNPRFLAFSSHYEFRPLAVRRGHPNDKPRTERSFWEVERSFLNGREFRDLADMRAQLAHWLDTVVDQRRLHRRTALERFAEEKEHLRLLPRHPYDTARVIYRLCSIDGFVAWDGNRYAVRHRWITIPPTQRPSCRRPRGSLNAPRLDQLKGAAKGYWVRRLATESAPSPKRVRLARVVRMQREVGSRQKPDTSRSESATRYLVIEAGALRVHVPELLERTQLEALLVSVGRAAKAGGE
jgi:transposase